MHLIGFIWPPFNPNQLNIIICDDFRPSRATIPRTNEPSDERTNERAESNATNAQQNENEMKTVSWKWNESFIMKGHNAGNQWWITFSSNRIETNYRCACIRWKAFLYTVYSVCACVFYSLWTLFCSSAFIIKILKTRFSIWIDRNATPQSLYIYRCLSKTFRKLFSAFRKLFVLFTKVMAISPFKTDVPVNYWRFYF